MEGHVQEGFWPAVGEPHIRGRFVPKFENGQDAAPTPYVQLRHVAGKDEINRRARPEDKSRFPDAWKAYEGNAPGRSIRTPLTELPGFDDQRVSVLQFHGVMDVEMLAELNDHAIQAVGAGAVGARKIAQMYLQTKGKTRDVDRDNEVQELRGQVERLTNLLEQVMTTPAAPEPEATKKPRRGRPPKAQAESPEA